MNRVLVALSGGVDSAAVVLLLRERGFRVEALYIDMLGSESARERAEQLAQKLEVRLHVESVEPLFRSQIIEHTLSEHRAGRTPSPCARCNPQIKWRTLCAVADRLAIDKVATGHYINIVSRGERFFVSTAVDPVKDQSYYLWALDQSILSRAITPLGALTKVEVREFLASRGFESLARGAESMGLCFMGGGSYADFLAANLAVVSGDVFDVAGCKVGEHSGFQLYTIGQKRGFTSLCGGEVRSIDPLSNRLVVGAPLLVSDLVMGDCVVNSLDFDDISVKVRGLGRNPAGRATVEVAGDGLRVRLLDDLAWAPAAGQPVVLYSGDLLIAGGVAASRAGL